MRFVHIFCGNDKFFLRVAQKEKIITNYKGINKYICHKLTIVGYLDDDVKRNEILTIEYNHRKYRINKITKVKSCDLNISGDDNIVLFPKYLYHVYFTI